jgi:pyruvate/2-oxoglutarate dehydrogenase complex dihydrolipoamide dehydrogenase (E3) component
MVSVLEEKIDQNKVEARFTSPTTLAVKGEDGGDESEAANIMTAIGAHPWIFSGVEVDGIQLVTYIKTSLQNMLPNLS